MTKVLLQALETALLSYQKRRGGADTLFVNRVKLFGYVSLVDDSGNDRGRLYARNHWSGKQTNSGKFSTIRVRLGEGAELEFARLILVFGTTLTDARGEHFPPEQLVLVRTFDRKVVTRTSIGQRWHEAQLTTPSGDRGHHVLSLSDVVDAWHLAPDVNYPHKSGHYIASNFIFSFVTADGRSQAAAGGDEATNHIITVADCGVTDPRQHQGHAVGQFQSPTEGTYAGWLPVTEPPGPAEFRAGLHVSKKKPKRDIVAHRCTNLGWKIGKLKGRVSKAPRLRKEKAAAEMYKVQYPDASDCEFHTLAAADYGVNAGNCWVFLRPPTAAS